MLVAVGSTNPTKIDPVKEIFAKHFKNVQVRGVKTDSGVKDQPIGDEETYQGALNRARSALRSIPEAEYGVGIEGGSLTKSYGWFEHSIIVIINRQGKVGVGTSGSLELPPQVVERLKAGENLGDIMDDLFQTKKIGEGIGMFGLLTNNTVTRTSGVAHGVAFALARFLHPQLYEK